MKTPIRIILMASIGSALALAQEAERNPLPGTAPEADSPRPAERPRDLERPRAGDRPRAEGDRFRPDDERRLGGRETDRPRRDGERPPADGERPRANGERPRPDGERPRPDGERPRPDGERPRVEAERLREHAERLRADAERRRSENQRRFQDAQGRHELLARQPRTPQPYLGIVTRNASPELAAQLKLPDGFGLVVEEVMPDSPAKSAGLERNDLITKFEDQILVNPPQLEALIHRAGKDKEANLTILRGGEERKLTVRIGERMPPTPRPFPNFPDRARPQLNRGPGHPQATPPHAPPHGEASPGGERNRSTEERQVRYARSEARVLRSDDDGRFELLTVDGARTFIAQRPDGTVAFRGPVETPEQKQAVPAELRKKLELLEQGIAPEKPQP